MEIIQSIEEVFSIMDDGISYYAGYKIVTNKQEIFLLIDDEPHCCENWGYFMSEDDISSFIGAELYDIKLTDDALNEAFMVQQGLDARVGDDLVYVYEGGVMFVNLETNRGTLQFVAYNQHNGYYSHRAVVKSIQLNEEVSL